MATSFDLKSILVPSKAIETEYPGLPGFFVKLNFLSRETLQNIRKQATKTVFKNRKLEEETNDDLFLELYVKNAITGWKGLKLGYLEQLAPVDLANKDRDEELDYSIENALLLMKNSTDFDNFVTNTVSDLGKFSNNK